MENDVKDSFITYEEKVLERLMENKIDSLIIHPLDYGYVLSNAFSSLLYSVPDAVRYQIWKWLYEHDDWYSQRVDELMDCIQSSSNISFKPFVLVNKTNCFLVVKKGCYLYYNWGQQFQTSVDNEGNDVIEIAPYSVEDDIKAVTDFTREVSIFRDQMDLFKIFIYYCNILSVGSRVEGFYSIFHNNLLPLNDFLEMAIQDVAVSGSKWHPSDLGRFLVGDLGGLLPRAIREKVSSAFQYKIVDEDGSIICLFGFGNACLFVKYATANEGIKREWISPFVNDLPKELCSSSFREVILRNCIFFALSSLGIAVWDDHVKVFNESLVPLNTDKSYSTVGGFNDLMKILK